MKVLVVGGGGREHALAWKLKQDDPSLTLLATPGNPGIAELGQCVSVGASDIDALAALATSESVDLTLVGPEAPLAAGIVDRFRTAGLPAFGPTQAAARIETSKAYAKRIMRDAGVPTARAVTCSTADEAREAVRQFGAPVVIKASGLAAGKGVIVCQTMAEANDAIAFMLDRHGFGTAGDTVLVEAFMEGEELSLFAITDGTNVVPLIPAQDHKRLLAGDEGPNTGGMGAYAPVFVDQGPIAPDSGIIGDVVERVFLPTLRALREDKSAFTGLLYAGLMLTADGPKVVEFNCRFGDPETQAILPVLRAEPSLLELMLRVAHGQSLGVATVRADGFAVTTVLASAGYPEKARTGDVIELPPGKLPAGTLVFHAGTARRADGALVTSGGRVLAITGVGPSFEEARERSRSFAGRVRFEGKQFRSDIGWRELARSARAS